MTANSDRPCLRIGMVGMGMIFDETYRPVLEQLHREGLYRDDIGRVDVELVGVATRTGSRAEKYRSEAGDRIAAFRSFDGPNAASDLCSMPLDAVCIATPDDRHFRPAYDAIEAGKHILIEKPSVLAMTEVDELTQESRKKHTLAKVVYHKLLDPDHKKLRTLVHDGILKHVNNGYCSLLEPKSISGSQFSEWIRGRNPATYVAVHYLKLIDFTFGPDWRLKRILADGQRGIVGDPTGVTWDSVQLRVVYEHPDHREACFDIHTSWVTPDNFPGYVEQEVQFRFDNGVWNAHQRKRGVEVCIEGKTPFEMKETPNQHYNASFVEPWGERSVRGYGLEVIRRFFEEVAYVEYGGPKSERDQRLESMRALRYNDISADRNCVAIVQGLESILRHQADGEPGCVVSVNSESGGLVLSSPKRHEGQLLYAGSV